MKFAPMLVWLSAAAVLPGCAAYDRAMRANEARQLAWFGPGAGPCAFGGATEEADAHCALVTGGTETLLQAVNARILARHQGADPAAHVEAASQILARNGSLRLERLQTCRGGDKAPCAVALLVTDGEGERFVLDSGLVVRPTLGLAGVATFAAFEEMYAGRYSVGASQPAAAP